MGYGMQGNKIPKGYETGRLANYTPQQMQLHQQQFANVAPGSYTSRLAGGDQSLFNEIEAPAFRQLAEMQGGLASRFSGMGMAGARRGSGFQNSVNSMTSNFAQDLQANRQALQRQAIQDLMGMSNTLLSQRPYDNFMVRKQPKPNPWGDIAGKFASAIPGAVVGGLTGGPGGAIFGGLSGLFGGGGGGGNSDFGGGFYDQQFRMDPSQMGY